MHQIQILKKYGLEVRGFRGQHLLIDENIQRKIIEFIAPKKGETLIEIGPGLGAITEHLLEAGAHVIAIEQDRQFIDILNQELSPRFEHLKIIEADVLQVKLASLKLKKPVRVVGNIPYYITSPILLYLINQREWVKSFYVMVQKELGDRFFAQPGSKDYGRLSLLLRFYTEPERAFDISKNCFSPRPKVDSTFVGFEMRQKIPASIDTKLLFEVIEAGFSKRRKNILNAFSESPKIKHSKEEWLHVLEQAGIDPHVRAEELLLKDFLKMTEILKLK